MLRSIRATERKPISVFLESLRFSPNTEGDFRERDDTLREIEVKIVKKWAIAYWAGHPVHEVKIVDIRMADR